MKGSPRTFSGSNIGKLLTSWPVSRVLCTSPGEADDHSSGMPISGHLDATYPNVLTWKQASHAGARRDVPIRSCSRWGLPSHVRCRTCGGLLPHHFTLPSDEEVYFLLHFPWGHPRRALPGTVFPWSPDFPPLTIFRRCKGRPSGQLVALFGRKMRLGQRNSNKSRRLDEFVLREMVRSGA